MEYKILVVDDNKDNLSATKIFLEDNGYGVDAVSSGEEAIQKAREESSRYALVILDYHLQGKTGAQTLKDLRAINPNLYILIYSGDTTSRNPIKETLRGGAVDFIEKSEDPDYLLSIVRQWCTKYDETTRLLIAPAALSENEQIIRSLGITRHPETQSKRHCAAER
jgi:DNA-binding NtrC family response regulator